jgi:hypothetical protein
MRRIKRQNCLATIGGKVAGTSLPEGRRGIGNSIHLKLLVCRWCDCPASKRPKLFSLIANAATLLFLLAGCSGGVLEPQGPIGAANIQILLNALGIMLVIVVPTIIGVLVFAWWFRARPDRDEEGLRSRPMRRLHRAGGRAADQFLPDARRHEGRREGDHY